MTDSSPTASGRDNAGRSKQRRGDAELPLERVIHIAEFRTALRAFLRHADEIAANWELTPQRYLLLLAIKGAPDGSERMSFSQLAKRLHLSRNTVTELCARAEEAGLIVREAADHDARVTFLRLTKEGDRRLCRALLDNDADRTALVHAFDELVASFRLASRP